MYKSERGSRCSLPVSLKKLLTALFKPYVLIGKIKVYSKTLSSLFSSFWGLSKLLRITEGEKHKARVVLFYHES